MTRRVDTWEKQCPPQTIAKSLDRHVSTWEKLNAMGNAPWRTVPRNEVPTRECGEGFNPLGKKKA